MEVGLAVFEELWKLVEPIHRGRGWVWYHGQRYLLADENVLQIPGDIYTAGVDFTAFIERLQCGSSAGMRSGDR